jgi:phenylpropionate dioxygenase-like ring-hydroxylating dioxygenase large terminal subunit
MTWHHLVAADQLIIGQIVAGEINGDDVVTWRDATGQVHVHEARCPHNWSHFAGVGEVQGCELVCTTHFWRFEASGRGFRRLGDGTEEPMRDIRRFACRERDGIIEGRAEAPGA